MSVDKHDDRAWLLNQLPKHSAGAEVGVYKGEFSARSLEWLEPTQLYLIDPWLYFDDPLYARAWYGGKSGGQPEMDAIYHDVVRRFGAHPAVTIIREKSSAALSHITDGSLDWVYIDGNHLYEFVRDDLANYRLKVKPGGLIAGDDYREGGWWRGGVKRAVDEFIRMAGAEVVDICGGQFLLRRL